MNKKPSKSLIASIIVFGLYGLTFPIAAIPDFTKIVFTNTPSWWYLYLLIGGVTYYATLIGISRWKKWAIYTMPVLLVIDTIVISLLTKAVSIDDTTTLDIVTGFVLIVFWLYVFSHNKNRFV